MKNTGSNVLGAIWYPKTLLFKVGEKHKMYFFITFSCHGKHQNYIIHKILLENSVCLNNMVLGMH